MAFFGAKIQNISDSRLIFSRLFAVETKKSAIRTGMALYNESLGKLPSTASTTLSGAGTAGRAAGSRRRRAGGRTATLPYCARRLRITTGSTAANATALAACGISTMMATGTSATRGIIGGVTRLGLATRTSGTIALRSRAAVVARTNIGFGTVEITTLIVAGMTGIMTSAITSIDGGTLVVEEFVVYITCTQGEREVVAAHP